MHKTIPQFETISISRGLQCCKPLAQQSCPYSFFGRGELPFAFRSNQTPRLVRDHHCQMLPVNRQGLRMLSKRLTIPLEPEARFATHRFCLGQRLTSAMYQVMSSALMQVKWTVSRQQVRTVCHDACQLLSRAAMAARLKANPNAM